MAVVDVFQSQTWTHFRHLFYNASTCISSVIQCFQRVEGTFSVQKQLRVKECRVITDIYKMAWALELKQKWAAAQSIWSRNDPSLSQTVCRMHASTKTVEQFIHTCTTSSTFHWNFSQSRLPITLTSLAKLFTLKQDTFKNEPYVMQILF